MLPICSIRTAGLIHLVAFVVCILVAIGCGQSCSDRPNEGASNDTLPPWRQWDIDEDAAWSPDGSKIIYYRNPAAAGRDTTWASGVFIHDVSTGGETCLWPNFKTLSMCWSPDGGKIAFSNANAEIYVYDFKDSSFTQITHANRNHSPRWSPCGEKLMFFVRSNGGGLYLYDFHTDSVSHIESRNQADGGDWMPNCSTVVMHDSTIYSNSYIVRYNVYTDSLSVVSRLPGYKRELNLSPDGQTIVFGVDNDLWAIDNTSGAIRQLTMEGGAYADWSPDGQWIVFTKVNLWDGHLWIMRPDGSEKHQITY